MLTNFENLESSAKFYNEVFSLFNIYKKSLRLNYYSIKYENVVNNFNDEIGKLLNFLGLEFEKSVKNFHITAKNRERINTPSYHQVIKPIYNQSINRYKQFSKIEVIKPIVNKWLTEFNYK